MSELHVRNLDPDVHARLRDLARAEGRSMSAQAKVLLGQALLPVAAKSDGQRAAIERLREIRGRNRLPAGAPPAEQLVREDRDAAR